MQTALSVSLEAEATRSRIAKTGDSLRIQRKETPKLRVRFDPADPKRATDCKVTPAILGNHMAIQSFLKRQIHQPTKFEFAASVNRPGYQASERLIIQHARDRELLAHVQVQPQAMRFGSTEIPIARFRHFAMLPEYRHQGYDFRLLDAAETEAKAQGAMLCVSRGSDYGLLSKHGWVSLGNDPVSIVSPRRLMGQLPAPAEPESAFYADKMPQYFVRIGRLTDADALQSLYEGHVSSHHGTQVRNDEYWSWLVKRGSHHRIYLFFESNKPRAYVVVNGASVLEIVDSTEDGRGSARLFEQVGADAIDQGRHSLRIHCPLADPIHQWADQADGQLHAGDLEESWMVKVPSVRTLLRRLAPEMFKRQKKQDVVQDLSVRIGKEEIRIARGVRSMKVTRGEAKRHRVGLTQKAAAQLLLGYRSVDELADQKMLVASTDEALQSVRILFPALNLWRPAWDDASIVRH